MKKSVLAIILALSACTIVFFGCEQGVTESSENSIVSSSKNDISKTESSLPESESSVIDIAIESESSSDFQLEPRYFSDVQKTAYEFFKAYVLGDIEKAKGLMDSPDNPDLEQFPSKSDSWCIGSMDKIESYSVEWIRCVYNEDSGITKVSVDIAYSDVTDESLFYINLILVSDNVKIGKWKIIDFTEEA